MNALNVLPPVVDGDREGENYRRAIDAQLRRAVKNVVDRARNPAVGVGRGKNLVQ